MSSGATPRPTSVTAFGWLVVLGSVFLVFSAFEQVASLSSLDSRRQVEEFLAEPPGDGLGIGLETTLDLLHVLSVVTGGCAAAAAVLGFFALRRNRHARLALSVVVAPMFVAGFALGGLLSALVAAGTVALWLQPARDWFHGVDKPRPPAGTPFGPRDRGERGQGERDQGERDQGERDQGERDQGERDQPQQEDEHAQRREPEPAHQGAGHSGTGEPGAGPSGAHPEATQPVRPLGDPGAGDGSGPKAYVGFGQPGAEPAGGQQTQPSSQPWPQQTQQTQQQPAQPWGHPWGRPPGSGPQRGPRPAAVLVACVVTWVSCAIVGVIMVVSVAALVASPDLLMDEVRRQNPEVGAEVARTTLVAGAIGVGGALVLWCVAASVIAIFVVRGQRWARVALAVSATVAAVGSALVAAGAAAMLLPAAAAATTAYCLLLRPDVRSWFGRS